MIMKGIFLIVQPVKSVLIKISDYCRVKEVMYCTLNRLDESKLQALSYCKIGNGFIFINQMSLFSTHALMSLPRIKKLHGRQSIGILSKITNFFDAEQTVNVRNASYKIKITKTSLGLGFDDQQNCRN